MFLGVQLLMQLNSYICSSFLQVLLWAFCRWCFTMSEVEAVLSECREEEDDSCATLARLKMAIQYEEKKVSKQRKQQPQCARNI